MKPRAHPFSFNTYGNCSTPDPIAEAQSANILPLKDPLSSFPNALLKKVLLPIFGEKIFFPSLMLISPVAALVVAGEYIAETLPETLESIKL